MKETESHKQNQSNDDSNDNISWPDVVGGFVLIYIGGWLPIFNKSAFGYNSFILDSRGFLFRINNEYFGVVITDRFFDSPFIGWVLLSIGLSLIFQTRTAIASW